MQNSITIQDLLLDKEGADIPVKPNKSLRLEPSQVKSTIPMQIAKGRKFKRVFDRDKFKF